MVWAGRAWVGMPSAAAPARQKSGECFTVGGRAEPALGLTGGNAVSARAGALWALHLAPPPRHGVNWRLPGTPEKPPAASPSRQGRTGVLTTEVRYGRLRIG